MDFYSSKQVSKVLGISARQLVYWVKTGLIKPALNTKSQRATRLYSFTNLVEARAIISMIEQGMSVQKIHKALNFLRKHYPELKNHLSEFKLITNGKDIFIIDKSGRGIKSPSGQIVMLVPFGDYHKEVKSLIKKKAVKASTAEMEALAKLSDKEFWEHPLVIEYSIQMALESEGEPSYSLEEVRKLLNMSPLKKRA